VDRRRRRRRRGGALAAAGGEGRQQRREREGGEAAGDGKVSHRVSSVPGPGQPYREPGGDGNPRAALESAGRPRVHCRHALATAVAASRHPGRCSMQRLLSPEQARLVASAREILGELGTALARLDAPEADLARVAEARRQIDELFLLVVVGEFNAGKTAFLNALLGGRHLAEGVLPTTTAIQLIRHGEEAASETRGDGTVVVSLPVDWLREVNVVDTPGTNAVIRSHEEITEDFVPRSDLVLFVTSADRPFTESERLFLERIRRWGKKVVLVVNKIDLVPDAGERGQILGFVRENARALLGTEPAVFALSARAALAARLAAGPGAPPAEPGWGASGFGPLEEHLRRGLDPAERLRLKVENPIGVAARLAASWEEEVARRREVLREDFAALDRIEEGIAAYAAEMRRDFRYHLRHVENVLYAMAERGDRFFDESLRLGRVLELARGDRLGPAFEREVVADTSREAERHIQELVEWMVGREHRQWREWTETLQRRVARHAEAIVGTVGADFESSRRSLIANVGEAARAVVESYDPRAESAKLIAQVQGALVQTAAVEAGALGLGAVLVAVLHSTLLDFTGVLGAGFVAALGLYVLPHRRGRLKAQLRERIAAMRARLDEVLTRQFETELEGSMARMRAAVAPYTRFVGAERERLDRAAERLAETGRAVRELGARVRPGPGGGPR